jgi:excisionase family DNA binding protein
MSASLRYLVRMDALLLSKQEAARMLGVSIRSLEHLISRQEIPTRKIGRRVLVARSAVETFATAQSPIHAAEENPDETGRAVCDVNETAEKLNSSSLLGSDSNRGARQPPKA